MPRRPLAFALAAGLLAAPLAAQAPRVVGVGRPVSDSLTSRDPSRRGGHTPYQVWQLDGRRGQRLTFDLTSSDFDAYLIVRDPDGYPVGRDDDDGEGTNARLHAILTRDGAYRVIATAVGDTARGAYTLAVSGWETPPAPAPGQSAGIAIGETKTGVLEPGDEVGADGPYQDRWTFDAGQGARIRVELRSEDFDSYLTVTNPDGKVVGADDDGLGERNSLVAFRATVAGRYTIFASSFGEEMHVGVYRVTMLNETGAFADPGVASPIRDGETKDGRLEEGDAMGPRGMEDRWTFQGQAGQVVRLDLRSDDFDAFLALRLDATPVDSNDDGGGGHNARILTVLPAAGTYTAVVTAFGAGHTGGRYTLSLAVSAPPAPPGRVARIAQGQRLAGRLETGDQVRPEGGVQDAWEFDGRAGQDVTIELRSPAFDTYLELRDPQGTTLAENDDGFGEGTDSFIAAHLSRDGRYRLLVRGYGESEAAGLYELALGTAAPAARPGQVVEARVGTTYTGRLEPGDSTLGDSTLADVFLFRPTTSGRMTFQLRSSDFDAYLVLQDAEGRSLASDDDGGSGTDAQLTFEVVAGRTYRIVANSYGGERSAGLYRLTLRAGG